MIFFIYRRIPLQLLLHALHTACRSPLSRDQTTVNMAILTYYFLMRPGEYCGLPSPLLNTCSLFRLQDIQMWIGARCLTILTCPIADIEHATFATLTFTNQKNGVRGEVIGHDLSGHLYACPVHALARRLVHLRKAQASPLTPLNAYHLHQSWKYVTAQHITDALRTSATALGPTLGFLPLDVSARSLRAGGAMALLCAFVDSEMPLQTGKVRTVPVKNCIDPLRKITN